MSFHPAFSLSLLLPPLFPFLLFSQFSLLKLFLSLSPWLENGFCTGLPAALLGESNLGCVAIVLIDTSTVLTWDRELDIQAVGYVKFDVYGRNLSRSYLCTDAGLSVTRYS